MQRTPASGNVVTNHIVFDIDWTMVAEIKNPTAAQLKSPRVVTVEGHTYFINEGLEEFVERLSKLPDVKISFFSGGKLSRNTELLSKIKLPEGRSLLSIAYKTLGREHLVEMGGVAESARFSDRFKKDLTLISDDLDHILMFDDTFNFVLDDKGRQKDQVFFTGTSFLPFDKFEDVGNQQGEFIPKTKDEWLLDRKKLIILNAAFFEAYNEYHSKNTNQTLAVVMKRKEPLLNFNAHQWTAYARRLWAPQTTNPKACYKLMESFL